MRSSFIARAGWIVSVLFPACAPPAGPSGGERCAAALQATAPFDIDPQGPTPQIHGAALFDGEHVWFAYNTAGTGSNFVVKLASFGCDGAAFTQPAQVSTANDANEVDPAIAVAGGALLVTWSGQEPAGQPNLFVRYRVFGTDGVARGDVTSLRPTRGGALTGANAWMPQVVAAGNGFVIAGAWGHSAAPAFQAFAQRINTMGVATGDGIDLHLAPDFTQSGPDIARASSAVWAAFSEEPNTATGKQTRVVRLDDGSVNPADVGDVIASTSDPSIAAGAGGVWLAAVRNSQTVVLKRVDAPDTERAASTQMGLAPAVAVGGTSGAVAWYQLMSATRAQIKVRPFTTSGALGAEVDLGVTEGRPYPMKLFPITEGVYLLAYQDGAGTAIRLRGRFIDLRAR